MLLAESRAHIQILNFKMQNYLTEYLHGTDVIIIKTGNVNNNILITWCKFIAFQKWIGNGFFFR